MDLDMYVIKTKRLVLRPLNINDIKTTHEYASDIENTKYMIHLPNKTIEETEQFLKRVASEWNKDNPTFYEWAIIFDGKHIGAVSIYLDKNHLEGEIGWIINRKYQRNGYATEAAKVILEFVRKELKIKKVIAHCDYRNMPSFHVMNKIGLTLESNDKTRRYKDNEEEFQEFMCSLVID